MRIGIIIFLITGCASAPKILPATERRLKYEIKTNKDKKTNFQNLSVWTAKAFVNSNETIKLRDEATGVIIAKGNVSCDALKLGNGFAEGQHVEFTLELKAQDKLVIVKVEDLMGKSINGWDNFSRPSTKEEMKKVESECIKPLVSGIEESIGG